MTFESRIDNYYVCGKVTGILKTPEVGVKGGYHTIVTITDDGCGKISCSYTDFGFANHWNIEIGDIVEFRGTLVVEGCEGDGLYIKLVHAKLLTK